MWFFNPSDPYREPAPEVESPKVRLERLGNVLRRVGMWRWRWIRRALGGRWEKFLIVRWESAEDDDRQWIQEFWNAHDEYGWSRRPRPVNVGSWQRVTTWSVSEGSAMRFSMSGRYLYVGTMRFGEFLGSRLALVAYYREDW